MRKRQNIFNWKHMASVVVMLLALAWLTVSLPYVNEAQMKYKQTSQQKEKDASGQEKDDPFSNTTEEKNESGGNTLAEYLHDMHLFEHHFTLLKTYYKCHPSDLYLAYHPELVIPPPEA